MQVAPKPVELPRSSIHRVAPPKNSWRAAILAFLILAPAIASYIILYQQAFPLPYEDDYNAILDVAIKVQHVNTWGAKALLAASHQESNYKLVLEHLLVISQLQFVGTVDFKFLIAFGDLTLIPIAWLLWRVHRKGWNQKEDLLIAFLPISVLFFSLSYWETMNWAMAALENLPVILFALLSIQLLVSQGLGPGRECDVRLWTGSISAVLSSFSLANGFLLAPIGLFLLARRRAYASCIVWCSGFAFAACIYAYRYVPVHGTSPQNLRRVIDFFCFLGCALPNRIAAFILGLVLASLFVQAIRSRFERIDPVIFYLTVWIFCTAALVAWFRGFTTSRYSIYSILLLVFAYRFASYSLLKKYRQLRLVHVLVPSLVLSTCLCVSADTTAVRNLRERRKMVFSGMNAYLMSESQSPMTDPMIKITSPKEEEFERVTLSRAIQDDILHRSDLSVK